MPTVSEQASLPADVDPTRCTVELQLYQADRTPLKEARDTVTGDTIVGHCVVALDGASLQSPSPGAWSLPLAGNAGLTPTGSVWGRRLRGPRIDPDSTRSYATVATTGGPFQWKVIETDPPAAIDPAGLAAHAALTSQHGAGQELFCVETTNNFGPAGIGTTFLDVPGLSATVTIPARPFVLEVDLPIIILPAAATAWADARIVFGAGPTQITANKRQGQAVEASVLEKILHLPVKCRIPNNLHTPTAGSQVTYKVQFRGSAAYSAGVTEFSVAPNPFGAVDIVQFRGYTT